VAASLEVAAATRMAGALEVAAAARMAGAMDVAAASGMAGALEVAAAAAIDSWWPPWLGRFESSVVENSAERG
jgi:hypothetical protein